MAEAFCHVVGGRPAEAIGVLEQLLSPTPERFSGAPPERFSGWTIPIEPFFANLHAEPSFRAVLSRLADRAR